LGYAAEKEFMKAEQIKRLAEILDDGWENSNTTLNIDVVPEIDASLQLGPHHVNNSADMIMRENPKRDDPQIQPQNQEESKEIICRLCKAEVAGRSL